MPRSELHLCFSLRGRTLDPTVITARTGLVPAHGGRAGQPYRPGIPPRTHGSWSWHSRTAGWDIDPLITEMLATLGPHQAFLADEADRHDASRYLTVVGATYGEVATTPEEADRLNVYNGPAESFEPFFYGDRVAFSISSEAVAFLATLGASVETHIDPELDPALILGHPQGAARLPDTEQPRGA